MSVSLTCWNIPVTSFNCCVNCAGFAVGDCEMREEGADRLRSGELGEENLHPTNALRLTRVGRVCSYRLPILVRCVHIGNVRGLLLFRPNGMEWNRLLCARLSSARWGAAERLNHRRAEQHQTVQGKGTKQPHTNTHFTKQYTCHCAL